MQEFVFRRRFAPSMLLLATSLIMPHLARCQDAIDELVDDEPVVLNRKEREKRIAKALETITMRVRVTKVVPEQETVEILWRAGGEGLGGAVRRGQFKAADGQMAIKAGEWSAALPVTGMVGYVRAWEFPTLSVRSGTAGKKNSKASVQEVTADFEFSAEGKVIRQVPETAPLGATLSFAFPTALLAQNAPGDAAFSTQLRGLSAYVTARHDRLAKEFPQTVPLPQKFALMGRLGGYGEGVGYGIRHNNPAIVKEEAQTLQLLGVNGLVGEESALLARQLGVDTALKRMYWTGPGATTPMVYFRDKRKTNPNIVSCPYEPELKAFLAQRAAQAIESSRKVGAQETWAMWGDEIGVQLMAGMDACPHIQDEFRKYLQKSLLQPAAVGAANWDSVKTYPLWQKNAKGSWQLAPDPRTASESLRYYFTYRFMTYATAQVYSEAAKPFRQANIPLFSMQTPSPSWGGAGLDWHEFYDGGANTALVFETSNRDPRVWQWESYLGDIARGISRRHSIPIGALVKPHRGAPQQRALSLAARGAHTIRWYTYGPDYAKGDSFSERPQLLDAVARTDRFLARSEQHIFDAKWAGQPQVAFVTPRSSEIWGRVADPDHTPAGTSGREVAFEDAKWVYLALAHAHVPVDILSEEQLAEGKLQPYKVLYVIGPNLRRDAAAKVKEWVRTGGTLWTDAIGLSRDEANQPLTLMQEVLGLGERKLTSWGNATVSASTSIQPYKESVVPDFAAIRPAANASWLAKAGENTTGERAVVARELLRVQDSKKTEVLARFADAQPALVRHAFGEGEVIVAGWWAGVAYSARIREANFDVRRDYSPAMRAMIAGPAIARAVYRPVVPEAATVEAVFLEKNGHRSIALMNWTYSRQGLQVFDNLRIALPGIGAFKSVRSLQHGVLPIQGVGANRSVVLPKMNEIDLLVIE